LVATKKVNFVILTVNRLIESSVNSLS
jgi:hypothetical protein